MRTRVPSVLILALLAPGDVSSRVRRSGGRVLDAKGPRRIDARVLRPGVRLRVAVDSP